MHKQKKFFALTFVLAFTASYLTCLKFTLYLLPIINRKILVIFGLSGV